MLFMAVACMKRLFNDSRKNFPRRNSEILVLVSYLRIFYGTESKFK